MTTRPNRRALLAGLSASLLPLGPADAQPSEAASSGVTWRAAPVRRRFDPALAEDAELWSFSDGEAEPVLRVRHGAPVALRLVNDTPAPLSLHWHGVRGPSGSDGVGGLSQAPVPPGGTFDYRFTPPDAGTFLARPLVLGRSGEPAGRGLAGLLVVEEREPPRVDRDIALLVRDWRIEPSGTLAPFGGTLEAALAGRLGNRIAVGGGPAPHRVELPAGGRLRLRLVNAANARIMRIQFDRLKVTVAAVDGQPSETFEPLRAALPFPPATRYDLLIDAPAEPGQTGQVTALLGGGVVLVEITTTAGSVAPSPDPVRSAVTRPAGLPANPLLPPEIRLQNALRRELAIGGGAVRGPNGEPVYGGDPKAIWSLGGRAGVLDAPPLFSVRRGQPVALGFHNMTPFPQPIHLHGHAARILHLLDDGWEPYWVDTLQVPEGKTARIAFLAGEPGRWLIGSTVLERLDTGLWGWFEVT